MDKGFSLVDALEPLSLARAIKTPDEITLIRQACAIGDVGLAKVQEAIEPGVTENDLFLGVAGLQTCPRAGNAIDGKLLTAGGNTNPWIKRDASDRLVLPGNLVAIDTGHGRAPGILRRYLPAPTCAGTVSPMRSRWTLTSGPTITSTPRSPISRSGPPSRRLRRRRRQCRRSTTETATPVMAHGAGMSDEWPAIYFKDPRPDEPRNYDGEIKENMVICMEASFGREGGSEQVKLEEQLLIKAVGPEIISQAPFDWRFMD